MDPLSIAALVVRTANQAGKLLSQIDKYTHEVTSAPKEIYTLRLQISEFSSILGSLAQLIQQNHDVIVVNSFTLIQNSLEVSGGILNELSTMLLGHFMRSFKPEVRSPGVHIAVLHRVAKLTGEIQLQKSSLQSVQDAIELQKARRIKIDQESLAHKVKHLDDNISSEASGLAKPTKAPQRHGISGHSVESRTHALEPTGAKQPGLEYLQHMSYKNQRYFNKLNFEQNTAKCIRIKDLKQFPITVSEAEIFDISLLQPVNHGETVSSGSEIGASQGSSRDTNLEPEVESDSTDLMLILCEATSVTAGSIPFTQQDFVTIMKQFRLPPGLFQAIFTGTPKFVLYEHDKDGIHQGFVLRTPMSGTENWTLALSWKRYLKDLKGIFHGLQSHEMTQLTMHLRDSTANIQHPLNIPVIVCEMLIESDSNGIKGHASELYRVELRTNYHGYPQQEPPGQNDLSRSPEQDFEEITRSLNIIISRLAFHEMRINANVVFVDQILDLLKIHNDYRESQSPTARLEERVNHLKIEQRALLLEISCNQKIAQSQLEIVYNLVAQRDNKDNLAMAAISTEIANTTKNDSFAMRTIAVMSIAFLPGTFVSSFFSMTMFNWQAPKGTSVVSTRFWIYWAVTVPLTLVVFCIWFFWLRTHHKHDNQRRRMHPRQPVHDFRPPSVTLGWTKPSSAVDEVDEEAQRRRGETGRGSRSGQCFGDRCAFGRRAATQTAGCGDFEGGHDSPESAEMTRGGNMSGHLRLHITRVHLVGRKAPFCLAS